MATHSSILAWRIPGTEEPGGLLSMGLHRVGQNWSDLAAAAALRIKTKISGHCKLGFTPFFGLLYVPQNPTNIVIEYIFRGWKEGKEERKKVKSLSRVQLCDPMNCSPPGSSVHGILQQKYWRGVPSPSPGYLPSPGIEPCRQTLLPSEENQDHLRSSRVGKSSLLQWSKSRLASRLHCYPTLWS